MYREIARTVSPTRRASDVRREKRTGSVLLRVCSASRLEDYTLFRPRDPRTLLGKCLCFREEFAKLVLHRRVWREHTAGSRCTTRL